MRYTISVLYKPFKRVFTFHFYSPRFKPWAINCNGIGAMDLSFSIAFGCPNGMYLFLCKPFKRVFAFRFHSPRFKPWAMKCNDIDAMDLSISLVFDWKIACNHIVLYEWGIQFLFYTNRLNGFLHFIFIAHGLNRGL